MRTIKVYTASYCSYCQAAKKFLQQLQLPYEEINLDDQDELRAQLSAEQNGWRTVPMIFIGEEFIGGYTDMVALHQGGKLLAKVQAE